MLVDQLWGVCRRIESWIATQRDIPSIIPMKSEQQEDDDPSHVFTVMQWPFVTPDSAVHAGIVPLSQHISRSNTTMINCRRSCGASSNAPNCSTSNTPFFSTTHIPFFFTSIQLWSICRP